MGALRPLYWIGQRPRSDTRFQRQSILPGGDDEEGKRLCDVDVDPHRPSRALLYYYGISEFDHTESN
jgi:hypothetical protein